MTPDGVMVEFQVTARAPNEGRIVTIRDGNSYFGGTARDDTVIFSGGTGNYVNAAAGNDTIVFSGS